MNRYIIAPSASRDLYEEIRPNLRGVPLDGYIILYQLTDNTLEILRVVHGSRNLKDLFESDEDE